MSLKSFVRFLNVTLKFNEWILSKLSFYEEVFWNIENIKDRLRVLLIFEARTDINLRHQQLQKMW